MFHLNIFHSLLFSFWNLQISVHMYIETGLSFTEFFITISLIHTLQLKAFRPLPCQSFISRVMIARRFGICKFIFARVIQYICFLYEWLSWWWPDALGLNVNSNMTDTVINSCVNGNSEAPLMDCLPILTNDYSFWAEFENLIPRRVRASDQLLDHIDRIIRLFFYVKIVVHHPYRGTVTTLY